MIEAKPLSYALGAELTSIDMRGQLGEQDIQLIKEAWHDQHVIVLRNQNSDPEDILRFAASFGPLDSHEATPFYRMEGYPHLMEITTKPFNGRPSETRNVGRN